MAGYYLNKIINTLYAENGKYDLKNSVSSASLFIYANGTKGFSTARLTMHDN